MSWILNNQASLPLFLPELVLIGGALLTLLLGAFAPKAKRLVLGLTIGILVAFIGFSAMLLSPSAYGSLFSGAILLDPFAIFFKLFFGVVSLITLLLVVQSRELLGYEWAELGAFLLATTLGMSMMAASNDLLMIFLSLEMVSILSYVLVGYRAKNRASSEAGLKYILYGAVASGIMIFGFSYLFGMVGSTDLGDLARYFRTVEGVREAPLVLFSLLAVLMGLGYKMATFPSQMWCPDVYEGAPLPITTFLSVGPKAAGFALTIRFFFTLFSIEDGRGVEIFEYLQGGTLFAVLAAVTMTIGNLAAIPQRNLKRLMAYSSIAHAGYMLMAVAALSAFGIQSVLFYLITYLLMNLGAFYILLLVSNQLQTEEIDGYQGLGWRSPFLAILFLVFLCSLIGLPPFAGFVGKFYLFSAAIDAGLYWLVGVAALNTVVSLFYYFRIVKTMFLTSPVDRTPILIPAHAKLLALLLAVPTIILGVYWKPVWLFAAQSIENLF